LLGGLCRDDVADGVRAATRRHSRGEDPHRPTRSPHARASPPMAGRLQALS
jgi:hypothetical protein